MAGRLSSSKQRSKPAAPHRTYHLAPDVDKGGSKVVWNFRASVNPDYPSLQEIVDAAAAAFPGVPLSELKCDVDHHSGIGGGEFTLGRKNSIHRDNAYP